MVAEQPSVEVFGILIHTPVTAATDLVVSAICLVAYFRLHRLPLQGEVHRLFKYYFLSMSMATFFGGVLGHALLEYLPFFMKLPGWITSMLSVALLERAVIQHTRKLVRKKLGNFFSWLNIIELFTFMILSLVTLNFQFVLIHAGYGIGIVVAGFTGFIYIREKSIGSRLILWGVLAGVFAASFFLLQIGINKWFNHVDISHAFMMVASILFYKGARHMILDGKKE